MLRSITLPYWMPYSKLWGLSAKARICFITLLFFLDDSDGGTISYRYDMPRITGFTPEDYEAGVEELIQAGLVTIRSDELFINFWEQYMKARRGPEHH